MTGVQTCALPICGQVHQKELKSNLQQLRAHSPFAILEERTRTGALFGAKAQPGERPDDHYFISGAVAQPGERFNGIEEVEGSSPSSSTNFSFPHHLRNRILMIIRKIDATTPQPSVMFLTGVPNSDPA